MCQPTAAMAGPVFSYLRNPYPSVSGGIYDFYGRLHSGVGDSQIEGTWTSLDRELHINFLELKAVGATLHQWASGPPGHDSYGQFDGFIYQQARRDLVPHLVTSSSGAFYVITGSEHTCSSPSKTHSRLSEPDSRPPISS